MIDQPETCREQIHDDALPGLESYVIRNLELRSCFLM